MTSRLTLLPGAFAVCRLEPHASLPDWATGGFVSMTRTRDELSIVCDQETVPHGVQTERNWRCLRIAGALDFAVVGVVASLTSVLAAAAISVFVVSTFDTDYVLVKEGDLEVAVESLRSAGHAVS